MLAVLLIAVAAFLLGLRFRRTRKKDRETAPSWEGKAELDGSSSGQWIASSVGIPPPLELQANERRAELAARESSKGGRAREEGIAGGAG